MPIERKPICTPAATYPPRGGERYKVRSGDTWGSIATDRGLTPADLIRFNFGFPNEHPIIPAEVNWCLHNWVGCKKQTYNGKNWMFSDNADPGLVYLPPEHAAPATAPAAVAAAAATVGPPAAKPGVLAEEDDVTAGALRINDAYDLRLSRLPSGDYELRCFMKLQFFFKDSGSNAWTAAEKTKYVKDWEVAVKTSWGGRAIKTLPVSKKRVFLNFAFSIQEGGWMFDHWELTVTKIAPGSFRTSSVNTVTGNVTLDSEDLTAVTKASAAACTQRGAVHEFGHMLGIDDEYTKGSPHIADTSSIMHSCEVISMRQDQGFLKWLDEQIAGLGLE